VCVCVCSAAAACRYMACCRGRERVRCVEVCLRWGGERKEGSSVQVCKRGRVFECKEVESVQKVSSV